MLERHSVRGVRWEKNVMDCLGPQCARMILEWLTAHAAGVSTGEAPAGSPARQGLLWATAPYQEDSPAILSPEELAGAIEHLEFAVFRRYHNQLTRAERSRLDNTIDNALFKIDRYLLCAPAPVAGGRAQEVARLRDEIRNGREEIERRIHQARRADLKVAQLASLSAEAFEEFVGELFEMLGYEVERVGGSGDEGADLRLVRADGQRAVVQCKYQKQAVVGSPALQRFLGTIHHTRSHKGFFVTTSTFSLAAEKFAAANPIELFDGPGLVELIEHAIGPKPNRIQEPAWF
jgi:restriction system protein